MTWLMFYVISGGWASDVKIEHVTEAQCRAVIAEAEKNAMASLVWCYSPDGKRYPEEKPK